MAIIWFNISSAQPNCIDFFSVLAIRGVVEAIVNFCVCREIGQNSIEVGLVGAICCIVTFVIQAKMVEEVCLGVGLRCENDKCTKYRE